MKLPVGHLRMIEAVVSANPHTVVVLLCGSAVECPWADEVKAVLYSPVRRAARLLQTYCMVVSIPAASWQRAGRLLMGMFRPPKFMAKPPTPCIRRASM